MRIALLLTVLGCLAAAAPPLAAQDNYEIQVYPSETMAPGRTMVELHSNYTFSGARDVASDGTRSTVHTWHETIVDQQLGRWYWSFNPSLDRALHGPGTSQGLVFSPNFKVGYDFTRRVNAGLEYYGSLGPIDGFDPVHRQQHQLGPALDLNLGPDWEFNLGAIAGLTGSTDRLIVKMILGRRFGTGRREKEGPAGPH